MKLSDKAKNAATNLRQSADINMAYRRLMDDIAPHAEALEAVASHWCILVAVPNMKDSL